MTETTLVTLPTGLDHMDPAHLAAASFLSEYQKPATRQYYGIDLREFFRWCEAKQRHPFELVKMEFNAYRGFLETERGLASSTVYRRLNTLQLYFRHAVDEEYLEKDPTARLRLPIVQAGDERKVWLSRWEIGAVLKAARASSPTDWCLISLLAGFGLRVTSACDIRVEDFAETREGYRWLHTTGKFGKKVTRPIPPAILEAMTASAGDRASGPLMLRRDGTGMTRRSADRVIKRLTGPLGLPAWTSPHDLRRSWISNGLAAGIPLRDIQLGADHEDPRSTSRYDRRDRSPHGHPAMTMSGLYAAAAT